MSPTEDTGSPDLLTTIVQEQTARADLIGDVDVLFVGDSSCLMNIIPEVVSDALGGARVESLCTVGMAGPRGYAHVLERFFLRGRRAGTVVLAVHGGPLNRPPGWNDFEDVVATGGIGAALPPDMLAGIRKKAASLFRGVIEPVPQGWYGVVYGSDRRMRDYIRSHHGSLMDPRRSSDDKLPGTPENGRFRYVVSEAMRDALRSWAARRPRFGTDRVLLLISPSPQSLSDSETRVSRGAALATVIDILALSTEDVIPAVETLPASQFASVTHLNMGARQAYSRALGDSLARMPWFANAAPSR
jgi:hypothetical protein